MLRNHILVTGANGQLGRELRALEKVHPEYAFIFAGREELSIDDAEQVKKYFSEQSLLACINCAAYTAVDKAESEIEQAESINAKAVGYLAKACKENNSLFIHISTDYVFDGSSEIPYKEEDATGPINQYGATKLAGEKLALGNNPDSIIIRTSWVYSAFGNNFVKTMIRLMKERPAINVVDDQVGSPTYAADLAKAIMRILAYSIKNPDTGGIYHYSNEGSISWFEFAQAIKSRINSTCAVNPIPSSQYPTPAKRPRFSLLDKQKIKSTFQLDIPHWKESLQACIDILLVD